jgi:hypothetical protein
VVCCAGYVARYLVVVDDVDTTLFDFVTICVITCYLMPLPFTMLVFLPLCCYGVDGIVAVMLLRCCCCYPLVRWLLRCY